MTSDSHNPDVLSCLANLSNDEVFTPPKVVNDMLDLLPPELFKSKTTTFLDIGCKSGVFLREIARRLIEGLAGEIPDLQKRVDHVLHNQVYGIATTELTSLVSRRTLYCSKYPNCVYSASRFDTPEGNVRFRHVPHDFVGGRCKWCGASEEQFGAKVRKGLETHAYEFIHTDNPKKIFNMKFDVIVGNPPYQLSDGGGNGSSSAPIYQKFVEQAKKLNPRYLTMIIPARWYSGGKGLDDFRDAMLADQRISRLVDYFDAEECFPGVDISGGICYFLWDAGHDGCCHIESHRNGISETSERYLKEDGADVFVRFNDAVSILRKIRCSEQDVCFDRYVSSRRCYGLSTSFRGRQNKHVGDVKVYSSAGVGYAGADELHDTCGQLTGWKCFLSVVYGERGDFPYFVIGKPTVGEPMSACTDSYLSVGPFKSKKVIENVCSYIKTKFFRFVVLVLKNTQIAPRKVYSLVPLQDFSKPWTDAELYKKYKLTKDEIAFIESMIKPME